MAAILIVDDDAQIRRLVARILNKAGHAIHQAANGTEGLEIFQREDLALVITDIVMDKGEGIETIRALRKLNAEIPILAISGGGHNALYLSAATKLGATAALEKPFTSDQLLELVAELLRRAG